jgi:uncharacterized UPF0160 family protein
VGGKYKPENQRYDHHQRGFTEVFGHGFSTKLSSAGLVYKLVYLIVYAFDAGLTNASPSRFLFERIFVSVQTFRERDYLEHFATISRRPAD